MVLGVELGPALTVGGDLLSELLILLGSPLGELGVSGGLGLSPLSVVSVLELGELLDLLGFLALDSLDVSGSLGGEDLVSGLLGLGPDGSESSELLLVLLVSDSDGLGPLSGDILISDSDLLGSLGVPLGPLEVLSFDESHVLSLLGAGGIVPLLVKSLDGLVVLGLHDEVGLGPLVSELGNSEGVLGTLGIRELLPLSLGFLDGLDELGLVVGGEGVELLSGDLLSLSPALSHDIDLLLVVGLELLDLGGDLRILGLDELVELLGGGPISLDGVLLLEILLLLEELLVLGFVSGLKVLG